MHNRAFWAIAALVIGLLQSWDSGALKAGPAAQVLIGIGLLAPVVAIAATSNQWVRVVALIAGALLLAWARMIAPISLNALHIALFVPAFYILFVKRLAENVASRANRTA